MLSLEKLKDTTIFITPLSAIGLVAYHILKINGIKVASFWDSHISLQEQKYDSCDIAFPHNYKNRATVIVCSFYDFQTQRIINEIKTYNQITIIEFQQLFDIESIISGYRDLRNYKDEEILSMKRINYSLSFFFVELNSFLQRNNYFSLDIVECVITEKCTLRCESCAHLNQYYRNPKDVPIKLLQKSLDRVIMKADFIERLHFLGGEPFLNKNLPLIIEQVGTKKNIFNIVIYTNGTVIPTQETINAIKNYNINVIISNYGKLSHSIDRLITLFKHENIEFVQENNQWYSWMNLTEGCEDINETARIYQKCRMSCKSILHGKLFRCPFIAHAHNLKAIPYDVNDFINLMDISVTKDDLKKYLNRKSPFPGCNYCGGTPDLKIPTAKQVRNPVPYKNYYNYPEDMNKLDKNY